MCIGLDIIKVCQYEIVKAREKWIGEIEIDHKVDAHIITHVYSPLLASKNRIYRSSCPLIITPSTPPLSLDPVAPCTATTPPSSSACPSSVLARIPIPVPDPAPSGNRLTDVVTTAFTPVFGVPSYVSVLAIPIISSPVRVSKINIDESSYETTKLSPSGESGVMHVGDGMISCCCVRLMLWTRV